MKPKPTKPHFRKYPTDGQLRLKTFLAKTICRLSPLNLHNFLKCFAVIFVSDKEIRFYNKRRLRINAASHIGKNLMNAAAFNRENTMG